MTAVKSSKSNFFWTRYLNNIRGNNKNLIVNIVLELLGLPVLSVIAIIGFYFEGKELTDAEEVMFDAVMTGCMPFVVIAICTISASILMGSIIALSQYSYLYKKTITDMNYALPLSSTQRFFADYLSGFSIYIIIPLISIVLSLGILGVGSIFVDMSDLWEFMPEILSTVFIVIFAMIQYYTMSVFALTFCGNTFEAHFSVLAFAVMIPATIGCVWFAITETSTFGMVGEAIFTKSIFTSTNPVGAFSFFVMYIDSLGTPEANSMYIKWVAVTLVVTALYLGCAYLLHRFRKAEDVSKPYVYRSFFYTIMTMGTFCVLSLFMMADAFIVAGIVICAVVWFIMEVITRRGFKKFWTAPIAFTGAVISVLGICWICDITDGFGTSKRVPAPMNISSVTIDTDNLTNYYSDEIKFKDKDVIKATVELNKEIIDRHFNPEDYSYDNIPESYEYEYYDTDDYLFRFEYTTLTGSTTMRKYRINSGMADNLVKAILLSDEYAVNNASNMGLLRYSNNGTATNEYTIEIRDKLKLKRVDSRSIITARQLDEIRKAYIADMKAMTEDDLINGEVYCFIDGIWVLDSFENTKKALDVEVPEITSSSFSDKSVYFTVNPKIVTNVQGFMEGENGTSNYYYYKDDELKPSFADKITRVDAYSTYQDNSVTVGIGRKNVLELLKNCTPIVIGEMPLAIVNIGSYEFYLKNTPENAELLEDADITKTNTKKEYVPQDEYGWDTEILSNLEFANN